MLRVEHFFVANSIAMKKLYFVFFLFFVFSFLQQAFAQSTGIINRIATSVAGRAVLDPNGDGYTSATTSGFGSSDVTNSEITFVSVPTFSTEPYGDLRRGPDHLYSDFVPDNNGNGVYMTYRGGSLIFRYRVGSIMSGSKGYSILIDTDNKFGATGSNADPNYQAATTGTNGNPGFEIEVVLETNFRIAIYNVDGSSSPVLVTSYANWQDMSQISVAGTFDNGDPDFFIDFYIPFSDLTAAPFNLTTNTDLRFSATTVMSPQAAIGGPKSDIYGLSDDNYTNTNIQYDTYIKSQPPIKISGLSGGFGAICTAPPIVNGPIATGTVNISGTWSKSSLSAITVATINVYKNGVSAGTVSNVSSGSTWTLNGVSVANGDVITAKAQGSGESMCLVSNSVIATGCSPSNMSSVSSIVVTCGTLRGFDGTAPATAVVRIYTVTPGGYTLYADETTTTFKISRSGTRWTYDDVNVNSSDPCTGGATDVPAASYAVTIQEPGKCESDYYYYCNGLGTTTASPVITQTNLYQGIANISGTAAAGAMVRLFVNGQLKTSVTATAGNYSFPNIVLNIGDVVDVYAQSTGQCVSVKSTRTVTCYSSVPVINGDNNNQITAGSPITGTSGDPAGTVIKVYTSGNTLVATTIVQANNTWSTGNVGTTPALYNAVNGIAYYATAQNGSCGISSNSGSVNAATQTANARCGSITGPVTSGSTSVSGTLATAVASTVVNLYMDGINVGTTTTSTTNWTITVAATALYPNGTLTIGIQESGKQEIICSSSVVVNCSSLPSTPIITPVTTAISQNQSVTYTVSNAVAGYFYGIADASTGRSLATGIWATSNGNLAITTSSFNSAGSFNPVVKATSLSGLTICYSSPASASVTVSGTLPVHFLNVSANKAASGINVSWLVESEQNVAYYIVERSYDCIHFEEVGKVNFNSNTAAGQYSIVDMVQLSSKLCYRIRQVDNTGKYQYSSVAIIKNNAEFVLQVIPNPAKEKTSLFIESSKEEFGILELIDMNGKKLRQQKIQISKGFNANSITGLAILPKGVYIIKLITLNQMYHQKLIID